MTALHSLLVFLHVLAAALWMAAALWVSGDVRRTLAMGRPYVDGLAEFFSRIDAGKQMYSDPFYR